MNLEEIYLGRIIVYATKPIGKFIGEFNIDGIIIDNPKELWDKTKEYGGIDEEDFFKYFKDKDVGYAIKIGELYKYKEPIEPAEIIPNFKAPQSFMYLKIYMYFFKEIKSMKTL